MSATKEPKSRRDRPAKPPLSRAWIIAETIKIMESEGLEKATMRRVAQALDTGPASLYVYVANTAELHAAVLDQLLESLPPVGDGDWESKLEGLLGSYADLLDQHPGLARSAMLLRPSGTHAVRLYDTVLGLLLEGGFPTEPAAWGVDLMLQYVTATIAEHSAPTPGVTDPAAEGKEALRVLNNAFLAADPRTTPHIAEHSAALLSGTPDQRISWAIHVLLAGIIATPTPTM
ncbi:MAG: TetR/AcrR family transcriptional regulator [Nakamurella sp.]